MNATTMVMLAALVALLMVAPASAEGEDAPAAPGPEAAGPCQTFAYSVDPPAYHLDPSCIPLPG